MQYLFRQARGQLELEFLLTGDKDKWRTGIKDDQ